MGLLNSDKGDILINGEKNNNILDKFQKSISYVPQDIYLIDSSIKENVALKEQDELSFKNLEDIKLALKDAEFKFGKVKFQMIHYLEKLVRKVSICLEDNYKE